MKRIIAAIDALHFTEKQLEAFAYITREANGELHFMFLEDITGYRLPVSFELTNIYYQYMQGEIENLRKEKERLTKMKLDELHNMCKNLGIHYKILETPGHPSSEVKVVSRYADLLLINHNTSFALLGNNPPQFVKELLAHAECPVMVLPEEMGTIRGLVFSYNGSASSMYAIRQFTQLFPSFRYIPAEVIYADEAGNAEIPKQSSLKTYLEPQYASIQYKTITGSTPSAAFLAVLEERKDCLATFGAYGRNPLSRFFHKSDAESILRTLNVPLFITHP